MWQLRVERVAAFTDWGERNRGGQQRRHQEQFMSYNENQDCSGTKAKKEGSSSKVGMVDCVKCHSKIN